MQGTTSSKKSYYFHNKYLCIVNPNAGSRFFKKKQIRFIHFLKSQHNVNLLIWEIKQDLIEIKNANSIVIDVFGMNFEVNTMYKSIINNFNLVIYTDNKSITYLLPFINNRDFKIKIIIIILCFKNKVLEFL